MNSLVLDAHNLSKSFQPQNGPPVSVLKNINFQVIQGECVAITGRSGSGKSTLLALLAGLEKSDQGEVKILGKSWNAMDDRESSAFRAQHIGFVFQSFYLLPHLTVSENVRLPLEIIGHTPNPREAGVRVEEWLNLVGLWERRKHLPRELSGGEQQRAAIARALIHQPDLIFLDEPTGNLDETTGAKIFELIFSLRGKTSLVLVTHDLEQARMADRHVPLPALSAQS